MIKSPIRTKHVVGAGVIVGVGLGIWFGNFFKGPGLGGTGPGAGQNQHAGSQNPVEPGSTTHESSQPTPPKIARSTGDAKSANVLHVSIVDWTYLLRNPDGSESPIKLAELVKRVQHSEGDADGVKLRITMTGDSRASAEAELKDGLAKGGVPQKAVTWRFGGAIE